MIFAQLYNDGNERFCVSENLQPVLACSLTQADGDPLEGNAGETN